VIAGLSSDRLAATFDNDGNFRATPADMLAPRQFSTTTLLSDDQLSRAAVYSRVFSDDPSSEVFPSEPSLLYWTDSLTSNVTFGNDETRRQASSLMIHPLTLVRPQANTTITIPATLLPYRAILDRNGGISSAYSNRLRSWAEAEGSANTLLRFEIPDVCHPFRTEFARVDLRIRAGLRDVEISGGQPDNLQSIQTLNSPVGLFTVEIPVELLDQTERDGSVLLQFDVGKANVTDTGDVSAGERDDTWQIERVMLTLQGQRVFKTEN